MFIYINTQIRYSFPPSYVHWRNQMLISECAHVCM